MNITKEKGKKHHCQQILVSKRYMGVAAPQGKTQESGVGTARTCHQSSGQSMGWHLQGMKLLLKTPLHSSPLGRGTGRGRGYFQERDPKPELFSEREQKERRGRERERERERETDASAYAEK